MCFWVIWTHPTYIYVVNSGEIDFAYQHVVHLHNYDNNNKKVFFRIFWISIKGLMKTASFNFWLDKLSYFPRRNLENSQYYQSSWYLTLSVHSRVVKTWLLLLVAKMESLSFLQQYNKVRILGRSSSSRHLVNSTFW